MVPLRQTKWPPELEIEKLLKKSHELQAQIQNNFTQIYLIGPSTKSAQTVWLCYTKWLTKLKIEKFFEVTKSVTMNIFLKKRFSF